MGTLSEAGKTTELKDGMMKDVLVQHHEILLARIGDSYYATDNRCPHMRGRLSDGKLDVTIVTCPKHSSQFDIRSGEVIRWLKGSDLLSRVSRIFKSPKRLLTYAVIVKGDNIFIEI